MPQAPSRAGIGGGHWVAIAIFLVMVVVIFAGLLHHAGAMVFGEPRGAGRKAEAWSPLLGMLLLAAITLLGRTHPSLARSRTLATFEQAERLARGESAIGDVAAPPGRGR